MRVWRDMSRIDLLKEVIEAVDRSGPSSTGEIALMIQENGIDENMHVGQTQEFFEDKEKVAEWYLGQFLNIINKQSWFAMNSLINQSYSWVKNN